MDLRTQLESMIYFRRNYKSYDDCGWEIRDRNDDTFVVEENYLKYRYAIIDNNDVCLYLLNARYCNDYGNHIYIEPEVEHEGKKYNVKYVYLRCSKWNLYLPETVKEVFYDRTSPDERDGKLFFHGDSANSLFYVDKDNKYLCSIDGSLYSFDKKILYHWYVGSKLADEVINIASGAIYFNKSSNLELCIPKGVTELQVNAIMGYFKSIDFQGKIKKIAKGAMILKGTNTVIKINGLLADLTPESRTELRNCSSSVIFAAPRELPYKEPIAGYIQLSGVIEATKYSENRFDYDKDYKEVCLNACIHDKIGMSRLPIVVEEQMIYNMYVPVKGSRILLFAKDNNCETIPYIDVFESRELVLQRIEEAVRDKKN